MSKKLHQTATQPSKSPKTHHRSKQSSPTLTNNNNSNAHLTNNGYHQTSLSIPPSSSSPSIQCSAYFIHRVDLDNYASYTLKQTVDQFVSEPKPKGLKVKLSLPDEGLIIENIPDPDQSWMYKTSELLYFWRDTYYTNVVVVVTLNRSYYQTVGHYSASIFRLRGNGSVELFLQRAQEFFAQMSATPIPRNNSNKSIQQPTKENNYNDDNDKIKPKKNRTHASLTNRQSDMSPSRSLQATPVSTVARPKVDTEKNTATNSSFNLYNRRTYSETTVLSDTPTVNSIKLDDNYNNDDKITTSNNNFSNDLVAELMRELKQLRNEIAELKLESRYTPVRAASTSPLTVYPDYLKDRSYLSPSLSKLRSHSEVDAETQTDFTAINDELQNVSEENRIAPSTWYENLVINNNQNKQSNTTVNKDTMSNNDESHQEETTLPNFSSMNGSSNRIDSYNQQENQAKPLLLKPRPIIKRSENGLTNGDSSVTYSTLNNNQSVSTANSTEKELSVDTNSPQVALTNTSSTNTLDDAKASLPMKAEGVISFRSTLEDTIPSPEHVYENIPILIQTDPNQGAFYNMSILNGNDQQGGKSNLYVSIAGDRNSELQRQYLSQLFGPQNGISLLFPQPSNTNNPTSFTKENMSAATAATKATPVNTYQHPQQVLFANHLTNPLFNVDRQLLANTIANQFGIDPKSPYLQQLIANQHVFVAEKRTYANMIWQMTPEDQNALCSSPVTMASSAIEKENITEINNSTAKSILKSNKTSRSVTRKQRISWDNTLD